MVVSPCKCSPYGLRRAGLLLGATVCLPGGFAAAQVSAPETARSTVPAQTFLVGTWTGGAPAGLPADVAPFPSKGLYRVRLNADGSLAPLDVLPLANPSWVVLSADQRFVYVTNEDNGDAPGHVTALALEPNGGLKVLNTVDSRGQQPTHAALSPDGRYLFVANYSARPAHAGVAVFRIEADGRIGPLAQNLPFLKGSGAIPDRQQDGHAHSITFAPDGKLAYLADLGADVMRAYRYRPGAGEPLAPLPAADVHFPPGSGPRHLLFAADGRHAYATTEMGALVLAFSVADDRLTELQRLKLTESPDPAAKGGAGLAFSPDGRFLYVGNRRNTNQIVAYAVDPASGRLSLVGRYPAGGREPRAFAFDATGNYLLVADVFTNNLAEFRRDPATGALTPTRVSLQLGLPTDVKFMH
jgi:6-phosphogluconolactonase (cycloisomerase 2 family)